MRTLIYELIDGTKVNTLAEAQASGLKYSVAFSDIAEDGKPLYAKRQELMDKFGYVPVAK